MWPKQTEIELVKFYGNPDANNDGLPDPIWEAQNIVRIIPPYQMYLAWDTKKPVSKIAVH